MSNNNLKCVKNNNEYNIELLQSCYRFYLNLNNRTTKIIDCGLEYINCKSKYNIGDEIIINNYF
jgi:hypothetical protein